MFAVHEVTVEARYEVAAARLVHLINWGALRGVSEAAYEGGLEALVRVGPFGGAPGLSKLVRLRVLDAVGADRQLPAAVRPDRGRAGQGDHGPHRRCDDSVAPGQGGRGHRRPGAKPATRRGHRAAVAADQRARRVLLGFARPRLVLIKAI